MTTRSKVPCSESARNSRSLQCLFLVLSFLRGCHDLQKPRPISWSNKIESQSLESLFSKAEASCITCDSIWIRFEHTDMSEVIDASACCWSNLQADTHVRKCTRNIVFLIALDTNRKPICTLWCIWKWLILAISSTSKRTPLSWKWITYYSWEQSHPSAQKYKQEPHEKHLAQHKICHSLAYSPSETCLLLACSLPCAYKGYGRVSTLDFLRYRLECLRGERHLDITASITSMHASCCHECVLLKQRQSERECCDICEAWYYPKAV